MVGQTLKQRRHFGVLEAVELRNDVIAFFPGLHPVDKALQAIATQPEVIDALGKHAGEKEGVVADVFADLAFAIERGSWPEYRV